MKKDEEAMRRKTCIFGGFVSVCLVLLSTAIGRVYIV